MKKILFALAVSALMAGCGGQADKPAAPAAPAAPQVLSVEAVFDITGKVPTAGYLTVKGPKAGVEKDTVDATTGASKAKGTEVWNAYRAGEDKKSTLPGGIQSLVKYPVSPEKQYTDDNLVASKAADGVITIQYVHRGTAYIIVTDQAGKYTIPGGNAKIRKVANLEKDGSNKVAKDFSPTGSVKDIDWAKVWDPAIADGTVITTVTDKDGKTTEVKTGKITPDVAGSAKAYEGTFQITLEGTIMTVKGDLTLK